MNKPKTRKIDNAIIVEYSGDFKVDSENLSKEFFKELIEKGDNVIALDMRKVSKLLSRSITHLIMALKTMDKLNGKLFLLNIPDPAMQVLSMINIIGKFNVCQSESELSILLKDENELVMSLNKFEKKLPEIKIDASKENNNKIIQIAGSLVDGANIGLLENEIADSIKQKVSTIVLDFSETDLLDTVTVGKLLNMQKICSDAKIDIKIINANNIIYHVLSTNGVDKIFDL